MVYSRYTDKTDPWSSHGRIRAFLSLQPKGIRVLDVGTATGTIGRMCGREGLFFFGLEPNPAWAEIASPYYEELQVSVLEDCPDDFLRGYDIVICADVLEHLREPQHALRRLVDLQNDGSIFIVSVPNVANIWIRLNLLFGKFKYTDRGILDRTHLRFFTKETITELVRSVGLKINQLDATPVPLFLVFQNLADRPWGNFLMSVLDRLTKLFPGLFGYQFLIEAEIGSNVQ